MSGIRDSKTVDGVTYNYLTLDGKVVRQTWGSNVLDIIYDNSGLPYALKYNGGYYIYVLNQQGDVIRIVNSTGATVAEYRYDAWGNVIYSNGSMAAVNPIRYRGYYYDTETGFYYLQSRYYDPGTGRFINADAFASTGQGFLGYNMFAYCGNNPVSLIDSSGTLPVGFEYYMEDVPTVTKVSGISNQGGTFYSSSDVAAKAYAHRYFNHTRRDGIEYGSVIYSKTYGGKTVYWLGSLQVGDATTIEPNFAADQSLLNIGWDIAGFIHAHPNGISFSKEADRDAHLSAVAQYSHDDIYSYVSYVVFLYQRKYRLIHGMAIWENEGLIIYPVGSDYLYPDLSRQGQHGTIAITYYRLY